MEFFDKLSETITTKSKDIAKKAKDIKDINVLKSSISEQKKVIKNAYESIGEQYYLDHMNMRQHAYEMEFETIGEANAKLRELYEQLNALRHLSVCPACGASVTSDSNYCNQCGVKLPEIVTDEDLEESDIVVEVVVEDENQE